MRSRFGGSYYTLKAALIFTSTCANAFKYSIGNLRNYIWVLCTEYFKETNATYDAWVARGKVIYKFNHTSKK